MNSRKVTVLGAGSGGLSAAYSLALSGFDVTVCEQRNENELGYPWYDTVKKSAFEFSGIPFPPEENLKEFRDMTYTSPNGRVRLSPKKRSNHCFANVERRYFSSYLVSLCRGAGVRFLFGCRVLSPVTEDGCIAGVIAELNGRQIELKSPLTVDGLGLDSVIRKQLPASYKIESKPDDGCVFSVTRAAFESSDKNLAESGSNIYLDHCGHTGLDWVVFGGDCVDVLTGFFGKSSSEGIRLAVSDFRQRYPFIMEKIPGTEVSARIPLRKMLPLIVGNGYVLIGDSACMTEPMSGSGISLSMCAGKILADTVIKADGNYSAGKLWEYNRRYFSEFGRKDLGNHIIKSALSRLEPGQLDYLFEKKILTEKELAPSSYGKYTKKAILHKVRFLLKRPDIIRVLIPAAIRFAKVKSVTAEIPVTYDAKKIKKWIKHYNKI